MFVFKTFKLRPTVSFGSKIAALYIDVRAASMPTFKIRVGHSDKISTIR